MTIYLIHNTVNGKYYVGKTIEQDLTKYFQDCLHDALRGCKDKPYLYNAIRKYGPETFTVHPLMSTLTSNEQLCEQERFLIRLFNSQDPKVGYNIAKGGDGGNLYDKRGTRNPFFGKKHSDRVLAILRQPKSEATKRKLREAAILQFSDPDARRKLSDACKGRKTSAKHRLAVIASNQRRKGEKRCQHVQK